MRTPEELFANSEIYNLHLLVYRCGVAIFSMFNAQIHIEFNPGMKTRKSREGADVAGVEDACLKDAGVGGHALHEADLGDIEISCAGEVD